MQAVLYNVKLLFGFVTRSASGPVRARRRALTLARTSTTDPLTARQRPVRFMPLIATKPSAERRLIELGLSLPEIPVPIANFVPFRRNGDTVFLAGQICEWNGTVAYHGKSASTRSRDRRQGGPHLRAQSPRRPARGLRRLARPRRRLPAGRRLRQLLAGLRERAAGHQRRIRSFLRAVRRARQPCAHGGRRCDPAAGRDRRGQDAIFVVDCDSTSRSKAK